MCKTLRSLVRDWHGGRAGRPGKYISAKGPTNRIPFAPTRLVRKARLTRLRSRGAHGLRQTAFKSFGWKRISSTLCRKSAWLPTTPPSNMAQCISKPVIWTCGCLKMRKFITIGEAGAVIGATVSRATCSSQWTTNNRSPRPRPQALRNNFLNSPARLQLLLGRLHPLCVCIHSPACGPSRFLRATPDVADRTIYAERVMPACLARRSITSS